MTEDEAEALKQIYLEHFDDEKDAHAYTSSISMEEALRKAFELGRSSPRPEAALRDAYANGYATAVETAAQVCEQEGYPEEYTPLCSAQKLGCTRDEIVAFDHADRLASRIRALLTAKPTQPHPRSQPQNGSVK